MALSSEKNMNNLMNLILFFSTVGSNLTKNMNNNIRQTNFLYCKNINSIFLKPTDAQEIFNIIHSLKNRCGDQDNVHSKTIKTLSHQISCAISRTLLLLVLLI